MMQAKLAVLCQAVAARCNVRTSFCLGLLLLWFSAGCQTPAHSVSPEASAEIRALMEQSARDWNNGDIKGFMNSYARAETTRFASGGEVVYGWQTVLERYTKKYGDRAAMGTLTFSDLDITVWSSDAATVFGRWQLRREKDAPSGFFTLIFRKRPEGWRIVHDHTSAAEQKQGNEEKAQERNL